VLLEGGLSAGQFVAQAIGIAEGLFVIVGGFREERLDFGAIETAHHCPEFLLPQVERRYLHQTVSVPPACGRSPKIAVPIRTMVAPSSMATVKSWLIPMDSSRSRAAGTP
jgi:hypothetical protein